jgi:hypothetical protein
MLRNAAISKVMWMGRATVFLVGLAAVLALTLALDASPAFAADPTLTVTRTGQGTVSSDPGINCGADCSESYPITFEQVCDPEIRPPCHQEPVYQDVTLNASTPSGWSFQSWSGDCSGTASTCTLTMDADKTVGASWADVASPTVNLVAPTGPNMTGTVAMQATASDNDQVSRVDFFAGATNLGGDTVAPYSLNFDTTTMPDGPITLKARATDRSGRVAEVSRSVTIDNTDPTLSFTSGPNGQTFGPGTSQSWTFTAADATSGVQSVQCKVDGGSYGACSGGDSSHTVSNLPEGSHTLSVKVTDKVGRTTEGSRTFQIDATPPATSITSAPPVYTNKTTAVFGFTSSEAGSTFLCRRDTLAFAACTSLKTLTGVTPNGLHKFEVKATDSAGNTGPVATRQWFLDTVVPKNTRFLINNGAATTKSRTVTLNTRASDSAPASGVVYMRFRNHTSTTWTGWFPYASSKSWTLTAGAGTKYVYVQYKDRAGNISTQAVDSIKYQP